MRSELCDQNRFCHQLITAQAMLEKLKITLGQNAQVAQEKMDLMRNNIVTLLKKDGRSDYQAMYDALYMCNEFETLAEHVGRNMKDKKDPAGAPSEFIGMKAALKEEEE